MVARAGDPHIEHGTLELRVPDAQATVADAAAVAAVAHALVGWLAARHEAGELPEPDPTWRIEENRGAACRDGMEAEFADLRTGRRTPARDLLAARLEQLALIARALGCADELADAGRLAEAGGAARQRIAAAGDARAAARWLAGAHIPGT